MSADSRREMSSSRESQDAEAFRIDFPFGCPRTHGANGARGVLQGSRMVIARTQPVSQHESSNANGVEPFGDGTSLVIGQVLVSAAGANDDGRARRFFLRRQVRRQRRNVAWFISKSSRCASGQRTMGASGAPLTGSDNDARNSNRDN